MSCVLLAISGQLLHLLEEMNHLNGKPPGTHDRSHTHSLARGRVLAGSPIFFTSDIQLSSQLHALHATPPLPRQQTQSGTDATDDGYFTYLTR